MIDLYYWPTPNGWKISIMLEECGLPYTLHPVNIGKGEQFASDFLRISPNNRMPAIVDQAPADGGAPIPVFESGAILLYAPEKVPYAIERYGKEVNRLYGVLDAQLQRTGDCVAGAYSIADMAILPWVRTWKAQNVPLEQDFPHVQRWLTMLLQRPAVQRGLDVAKELRPTAITEEARKALFGQTAQSVRTGQHGQGQEQGPQA